MRSQQLEGGVVGVFNLSLTSSVDIAVLGVLKSGVRNVSATPSVVVPDGRRGGGSNSGLSGGDGVGGVGGVGGGHGSVVIVLMMVMI